MPSDRLEISWAGERLVQLAGRGLWWPGQALLAVADVHFGKAATFRARGIPVPAGTTAANLAQLDRLIALTACERLVFLGDLFHAREAHAPDTLALLRQWRARHRTLHCLLVEGNHDLKAGPPPAGLAIELAAEPWTLGRLSFCHHPRRIAGSAVIAGHLHPGITVSGRAGDALHLPCFWWREGLGILPAFGEFTGTGRVDREPGDRVVVIASGALYPVPSPRHLLR